MTKKSSIVLSIDVLTEFIETFTRMKPRHPDAVMLFRYNNDYLVFGEDAQRVMRVLEIRPVVVNLPDVDGFKYLSFDHKELDIMLPKIVRSGCRVAICENLDDPCKNNVTRGNN